MAVEILSSVRPQARVAFDRLWSQERERVWRLVARLAGNRDVADDLTQEVALRALESYPRFHWRCSPSTWLYRIAVNVVLRWRERRRDETWLEEVPVIADVTADRALLVAEAAQAAVAMERLPEELRTPLALLAWEQMTYKEIAAVLEIPIGTVMSRLHSARQRLRKEWGDGV